MAIPTTRTNETAKIFIDIEKCTGCGKCVSVCKDFSLKIENKKVVINEKPVFGCIGCGHCMAICPVDAITVDGRDISKNDLFQLPDKSIVSDYQELIDLYKSRRSIREFKNQAVEQEIIEKIIEAASYAPMGLPPTDVHLLVLDSKKKVNDFSKDFCNFLIEMKWFFSNWFLNLMRPFWGKETHKLFKGFLQPMFRIFTEGFNEGNDYVLYDAPLVIYFYGSPYSDPADPIVAATYAMLAGESLGLGNVMLGAVHPLIQNGSKAKKFRQKHGIKYQSREGLFVAFGYPDVKYHKGIKRRFADVSYL